VDEGLVPGWVSWVWWKEFVGDYVERVDGESLVGVNKRWQFGDLRLGRINSFYRIRYFGTHFVKGYLYVLPFFYLFGRNLSLSCLFSRDDHG